MYTHVSSVEFVGEVTPVLEGILSQAGTLGSGPLFVIYCAILGEKWSRVTAPQMVSTSLSQEFCEYAPYLTKGTLQVSLGQGS